jgi:long-chain fatty acid transport protein
MKIKIIAALAILPFTALAGGFQIPQQGIKSTGIAGAYTAICMDASSAFFNPAGMNNLYGQNFTIGGLALMPYVSVQTPSNYNTDQTSSVYTPIEFYYVGQICDKWRVGLSINNQFGSAASYPDNWEGMYIVQSISLKTYMFQPTVSYQVCKKLSIGAGPVYTLATFDDTKAVPLSSENISNGQVDINGTGSAFGYNVGLFSKIWEHGSDTTWKESLQLGADYRSGLPVNISKGNVTFSNIPASLATQFPSSENFSTNVNLPAVLSAGVSFNFSKGDWAFLVTYDFNYTFWSTYDSLHITFSNPNTPNTGYIYNYKNAMAHRMGAAVTFKKKYTLRGGFYIDGSPVQDGYVSPEVVDKTNSGFSVGASYMMRWINQSFTIDVAYLRSDFTTNTTSWTSQGFNATYHRIVNIFGLGVTWHFRNKSQKPDMDCPGF